ncbi:MAG TPA: phosphotransferase [Mycobacteriales bacterium]|nr:phosphotransferase [Mycobacteriales bacterium]
MAVLRENLVADVVRAALGPRRIVSVAPLYGGHSGSVWRVVVAGPSEVYVLRIHRRSASACAVEAALAHRLRGVVPVPEVVYADPDGETVGAPVTLSRWMPGHRLEEALEHANFSDALEMGHSVGLTLARIGSVRFDRGGFFTDAGLKVRPACGTPAQQLIAYAWKRLGRTVRGVPDKLRRDYVELIVDEARHLNRTDGASQLVHAAFGPRNLLVTQRYGRWKVAAVLDWESAFSGSPLGDVASVLRFGEERPEGYVDGFLAGFREGGGELSEGWEKLSRILDVYAMCDILAADPPGPATERARIIVARSVARGEI